MLPDLADGPPLSVTSTPVGHGTSLGHYWVGSRGTSPAAAHGTSYRTSPSPQSRNSLEFRNYAWEMHLGSQEKLFFCRQPVIFKLLDFLIQKIMAKLELWVAFCFNLAYCSYRANCYSYWASNWHYYKGCIFCTHHCWDSCCLHSFLAWNTAAVIWTLSFWQVSYYWALDTF